MVNMDWYCTNQYANPQVVGKVVRSSGVILLEPYSRTAT